MGLRHIEHNELLIECITRFLSTRWSALEKKMLNVQGIVSL